MDRNWVFIVICALFLASCSGGGSSSSGASSGVTITQPDPNATVSGGGVKGPLVNATATLFLLDVSASDLKGTQVSQGSTDARAALQGIVIPAASQDTYFLEVTANDDTIDLNSGAAPIITSYQTIVSAEAIRNGQVFATPVTTLSIALSQQSAPFASIDDLNTALASSARQVISSLGFGLNADTNPFTSNPLLTEADATDEQQARVLAYRLAVEGLAAILNLLATEIQNANPGSTVTVDDVLSAIAADLADGVIDGQAGTTPLDTLSGVADINAVVTTDPATLMIPGTDTPITQIASIVASETTATGITVSTANITSGSVTVTARTATVTPDSDGDGVPDRDDAFPSDSNESVDTDGDGTGNNADTDDDGDGVADGDDAFPLNRDESLDTDADGIGNNADTDDDGDGTPDANDALPLNPNETVDTDGDGIGNNEDTDDDGDGAADTIDFLPLDNSEQTDTDGDGIGNNADTDDDGDGVADVDDNLPLDPQGSVATSTTIGVNGGTATSPDGLLTLTFPAGAVSEDTAITIGTPSAASNENFDTDEAPLDSAYLLGPDGLQFSEPVAVSWSIPSTSSEPDSVRLVATVSDGIAELVDGEVTINPTTGKVTASITHFSEILFLRGSFKVVINTPGARRGGTLLWEYMVVEGDTGRTPTVSTQETTSTDLVPPEIVSGETVISNLQHESGLLFPSDDATTGTISAICDDASEDGLTARMGFFIQWSEPIAVFGLFANPDEQGGLVRVEADGVCRETLEISEPAFVSIGEDVDRITEARLIIPSCSVEPQDYYIIVSNTQTSVTNAAGTCSENLNFTGGNNSIFGALALTSGGETRLFQYGESGVFIVEIEDGVFGELTDFTSTTTDVQRAVNDDGTEIENQAYSVNNSGRVKFRTLDSEGKNTSEDSFSTFSVGLSGKTFAGYSPTTSDSGFAFTSETPSRLYYVDLEGTVTATDVGAVGDTALGISCARLTCNTGATCGLDNTETVGCAVAAFGSEELHTFIIPDALTHATNTPTINFTVPLPGVKTASPYVTSNHKGQMVTATVNDNEIGKVRLSVRDKDGTEVNSAEFFLTSYESITGFVANGSSIVLIKPSAQFPNGAVKIGLRNTGGEGDGVLTIPVTEALLGTSPEPFFGPAFTE